MDADSTLSFEIDNVAAYRLLLRIEVALREVVRASMQAQFGSAWRKRIPGDLLKVIREQERDEEARRQFDFAHLGPLYYLTFGQLTQLIRQGPGKDAVARLGGESFVAQVENILSPRNAIGHSRGVSAVGLQCIRAVYHQIETALGQDGFRSLLSNPDVGLRAEEALGPLLEWLEECQTTMMELNWPCPSSNVLEVARDQYWWAVADLAPFDCGKLERALALTRAYNELPQGLGAKALRQQFIEERSAHPLFTDAISCLRTALLRQP